MDIGRRPLLLGTAALTSGALLRLHLDPRPAGAAVGGLPRFDDPLGWPAFVDARSPVGLEAVTTRHRFSSALPDTTPTLAYRLTSGDVVDDGRPRTPETYLGPTLVVPTGHAAQVSVENRVTGHPLAPWVDTRLHGVVDADRTTPRLAVHLHGGNTRPEHDGGPLDTSPPTHGWPEYPLDYAYDNDQDAAGLWYHDHALGITRLNVHAGLAAGYLVRDTDATGIDTGDGRHLPAPPFEVPLVLQDRTFAADGSLVYPGEPGTWVPEQFGDVAVVNGTAFPHLDVALGVYRFRVYNGSNARVYDLSFEVGDRALPFWQIGGDGGLLDHPVPLAKLLLTPGERADLLVDFRGLAGRAVLLRNRAVAPFPSGPRSHRQGGAPLRHLLQFRVGTAQGWVPPRPVEGTELRPAGRVARLDAAARTARVRTHSLVEVMDPASGEVLMGLLDNREFLDTSYTADPVVPGSLEVWELVNATADTHPVHLHLVQFQVLDRQPFDVAGYLAHAGYTHDGHVVPGTGQYPAPSPTPFLTRRPRPPAANELGWKDTVAAPPGEVTRIAVPFGWSGAPLAARRVHTGDYVWHCHILDHEDNDMMQRYRIG